MLPEWFSPLLLKSKDQLFQKLHPFLPIFSISLSSQCVVYIPGTVDTITSKQQEILQCYWSEKTTINDTDTLRLAKTYEEKAISLQMQWDIASVSEFSPECLTVYLSNTCNCECSYCYTSDIRQRKAPDTVVTLRVVLAAARLVIQSCRRHNKSFKLIIHGGGEPTLHWELLQKIVGETKNTAAAHQIRWWGHIATNGVIPEHQAVWIAKNFDSIGVSHDGPPEIQNVQRPIKGGGISSITVERTIEIFRENQASFAVRTTLLPGMIDKLPDIVDYIIHRLKAVSIRLEPVYRMHGDCDAFQPSYADAFVSKFLTAKKQAAKFGAELSLSGVRMGELHGSYCNTSRNTLHIVPGDIATACFFAADRESAVQAQAIIGQWNEASGEFILDRQKIRSRRFREGDLPTACKNCICIYHCARGCPDICAVQNKAHDIRQPFRCRTAQLLTVYSLLAQTAQEK